LNKGSKNQEPTTSNVMFPCLGHRIKKLVVMEIKPDGVPKPLKLFWTVADWLSIVMETMVEVLVEQVDIGV
jgi:hypothetical protein